MGFEIADFRNLGSDLSGQLVVYLEAGPNPITEEAWATYTPDPGWMLNTPRAAQFDMLIVLGSPYVPTGEYTYYTDLSGYTWKAVAAVQNRVYPFSVEDYASFTPPLTTSAQAAYALTTPLPGTIQYNSNDKNHENIYYANSDDGIRKIQYYVTDPWGNLYILKSVNAANDTAEKVAAAVDEAVLPDGWVKSTAYLEEDTTYLPVYSGDVAHANEFRDSADSAWMQIFWGASGITLPAMVGEGMPIWHGNDSGLLLGTAAGDEMHGGGGDDEIRGLDGDDTIWSDDGDNVISGGAGADIIHFGAGRNLLRDTLADLSGDSIHGLGSASAVEIQGSAITRAELSVTANPDGVTLGAGGSSWQVSGDFSGGDFMAVVRGTGGAETRTTVSFVNFLPELSEGARVEQDVINGIANGPFLTGDGATGFTVELQSAVSDHANVLGYYTLDRNGTIGSAHLLFDNTLEDVGRTARIDPPADGEQVIFFLIQDGADVYSGLQDDLHFVLQTDAGGVTQPLLYSASLGLLSAAPVFHSIAAFNPDGGTQVLSGVAAGGEVLQIGFEDLAFATGDNDFQDVVVGVREDRAGQDLWPA